MIGGAMLTTSLGAAELAGERQKRTRDGSKA